MGLEPVWIIPNRLFAVTYNGTERYINFARSPLSNRTATSLVEDKHATHMVLERQGFPDIPFLRPRTLHDAEAFLGLHRKIIARPIRGADVRDIHIIAQPAEPQTLHIQRYILEG